MGDFRTLYLLATAITFVVHAFIAGVSLAFNVMLQPVSLDEHVSPLAPLGTAAAWNATLKTASPRTHATKAFLPFLGFSY